jgi:hypothetical protein
MLGGYLKKWPNLKGVSEVIPYYYYFLTCPCKGRGKGDSNL